jgi:hypothetical protein
MARLPTKFCTFVASHDAALAWVMHPSVSDTASAEIFDLLFIMELLVCGAGCPLECEQGNSK